MIVRFVIVLAVAVHGTAITATVNGSMDQDRPGYHITLKECIETGLQNNYSVRIMRNVEQQAVNNATRGNAGQLPTLDLSASYGGTYYNNRYYYPDGEQVSASSLNNNIQAGVDMNWTLFDGFAIRANYQKLQELKIKGELDMRLTLEDFVASVASEYYLLIRQKVRLDNLRQSVTLSRERLRIVQESFHIGASSGLDYQQAQVDYNADTSDYLAQAELVNRSIIKLNELLALDDVERNTIPADTSIKLNLYLDKDQLWHNTLKNNTTLLKSISDRTISELDLKRVQGRNYPYLRLNAGYGYRQYWYTNSTYDRNNQFGPTLGASMGFAIYDAGNRPIYCYDILSDDEKVHQTIRNFLQIWRNIKPFTTGSDLRRLPYPAGSWIGAVLDRLRKGWIDEEISSREEEEKTLEFILPLFTKSLDKKHSSGNPAAEI